MPWWKKPFGSKSLLLSCRWLHWACVRLGSLMAICRKFPRYSKSAKTSSNAKLKNAICISWKILYKVVISFDNQSLRKLWLSKLMKTSYKVFQKIQMAFFTLHCLIFLHFRDIWLIFYKLPSNCLILHWMCHAITMKIVDFYFQKGFSIKAWIYQTTNIWYLRYNFLKLELNLVPTRIGWAKLYHLAVWKPNF